MAKKDRFSRSLGEYQRDLERYENFNDGAILPGLYSIVRVDGRRAGAEWNTVAKGSYPYAETIVDAFVASAHEMFCSGFRTLFAFIHGDEVSIVLDVSETANARRRHKVVSLLASSAAVGFMKASGLPVYFHAKLSELPTREHVEDYFLWQRKVASRNFFSSILRNELSRRGDTANTIDEKLSPLNEAERLSLCREFGFDPNSYDPKVRLGIGMKWRLEGSNPELQLLTTLPESEEDYALLLRGVLQESGITCDADPSTVPLTRRAENPPPAVSEITPGRTPFRVSGGVPRSK